MTHPSRTPHAWPVLTDDERAALLRIACGELPTVETLEVRNRDCLDFHDVSVWGVREALSLAYLLGARRWALGSQKIAQPRKRRTTKPAP